MNFELTPGMLLTGRNGAFSGRIEVLKVNTEKNEVSVMCTTRSTSGKDFSSWSENFNLQHTLFGIENGDYVEKVYWPGWPATVIGTTAKFIPFTDLKTDAALLRVELADITVFYTFSTWVNKASSWIGDYDKKQYKLICIDKDGFACEAGSDFMTSRDADRFPVTAYFIKRSQTTP